MKKLTKNLFQEVVSNFNTLKDKNNNQLVMHSLMISQGDNQLSHYFNKKEDLVDIRSISKAFLCVALGIGIDEGLEIGGEPLTVDTNIWKFFQNKIDLKNKNNIPYLEKVTLKHLLTHSMGFSKGLMFSKDIKGIKDMDHDVLLDYIFNTDLDYEPGKAYVYSNVGPYLISIMMQDGLGVNFSDWANEKLLSKLEISNYSWKNYGNYCAGCTGLTINSEDLHKLGILLNNNGSYNGNQIVSEKWVLSMHSEQILTPATYDNQRVFPKYAYGLLTIVCKDGIYYSDGKHGQYLIIIPHNNMVISTLANQIDTKPITEAMRPLL